jgi:DNA-binding response OmpR family regulator
MKYRLLYIEDEPNLGTVVKETLEIKGYDVLYLKNGVNALEKIKEFDPHLCLLDVMLPLIDGFELGTMIRRVYSDLPIIFLTAKSQTKDVVQGFASGGTDYLKKPFSMEELIARVEVQIKLASPNNNKPERKFQKIQEPVILGIFTYFPDRLELISDDKRIKLSHKEDEILNMLCQHINQSVDRRDLMKEVWEDDSHFISRTLDVYIRKLREYFTEDTGVEIITLKGKGYQFSVK